MRLYDVLKSVEIIGGSGENPQISGLCYDTRQLKPGDIFLAIPGCETNGYNYIMEAALKGASAIVCEQAPPRLTIPVITVRSARQALALMSANYYGHPAEGLKLIGVTGTNGKTTTTYLLKTVLEELLGEKVGIIGTNSHTRTTPESLELNRIFREMLDDGCTHVVMEVSSHALALDRVYGLPFEVGIFTNLTQDHLDFHKTMEDYAAAKARLFSQCRHGVINMDDPAGRGFAAVATGMVHSFSTERFSATYRGEEIDLHPDSVSFQVVTEKESQPVYLPIPGGFSVYNGLGVVAAACALGLPLEKVCQALRRCAGVKGRLEVTPWQGEGTVIIDYAHTPDALENVLSGLRPFTYGRLLCLFGCGGNRDRLKRPRMGAIASRYADVLFVTTDNPRYEEPEAIMKDILRGMTNFNAPVIVEKDRRRAIELALAELRTGDTLLLAGKGHEVYQEIAGEQYHFDEREIVKNFGK